MLIGTPAALADSATINTTPKAQQPVQPKLREKGIMSRLGCESIALEARGDAYGAKVARGVAMLAAFLHEGKHTRPASADALRAFWAHYHRVHGSNQ